MPGCAWPYIAIGESQGCRSLELACSTIPGHTGAAISAWKHILGRFVDAAYAYRFGPPGHDVIAVEPPCQSRGDVSPFAPVISFPRRADSARADVPSTELGIAVAGTRP